MCSLFSSYLTLTYCVCVYIVWHTLRTSVDNIQGFVLSFHHWVLGIEIK